MDRFLKRFLLYAAFCAVVFSGCAGSQAEASVPETAAGDAEYTVMHSEPLIEQSTQTEPAPETEISQAETMLQTAETLAESGQYRKAIQILDFGWKDYGYSDFYDKAAQLRLEFNVFATSRIAAGENNTILIHGDNRTEIAGRNDYGEMAANGWTDIVAVSIGDRHVVGLKKDGTVVAAGSSKSGRCGVSDMQNIVSIAAGDHHTVALTQKGKVLAVGLNEKNQCDTQALMKAAGDHRIVGIAAGHNHTLALLDNGTVAACGNCLYGETEVADWTDITAIYAGSLFSAGLKSDGTVLVTGQYTEDWDLSGWTDIIHLAAGENYLIGLTFDGTLLSVGMNSEDLIRSHLDMDTWENIVHISAGDGHTAAVDAEGTVFCAGIDNYGQCDLQGRTVSASSVSSAQASADSVRFENCYADGEYAVITGLDAEGNTLWTYTTDEDTSGAQLPPFTDIGLAYGRYYFCDAGDIVALDAATGSELWRNGDFAALCPCGYIDQNGTVYLSGYMGPDLFVIDSNGKTLHRTELFDEDYCWPLQIEETEGFIAITFDLGPDAMEPNNYIFYIDPVTFSWHYHGSVAES